MTHPARTTRRRRAFALVAVMWVVIVASFILLAMRRNSWSNATMAKNHVAAVQARWLARAGVEQALAVLTDDLRESDGADDLWYDSTDDFQEVDLNVGTFTVSAPVEQEGKWVLRPGLVDQGGLLNINSADANQLAAPDDLDLTEQQVDSILDWMDADDQTRNGGAEGGYYNRLDFPYEIRNGPLVTVSELRLIRDIDDATFYGEDRNLNGILDANEDDDHDGTLRLGLAELCTIYSYERNLTGTGEARVNLNTAARSVLTDQLNFSNALAREVNRQRRRRQFRSLMDLVGLRGQGGGGGGGGGGGNQQGDQRVNEITLKWLADNFDALTVTDQTTLPARINVNTAPRQVLLALPDMTTETADAIIERRSSAKGAYASVGELLNGPLTEQQFRGLAEKLSVRSSVFEIHSVGTTRNGVQHETVAIVDRDSVPPRVLYWYDVE